MCPYTSIDWAGKSGGQRDAFGRLSRFDWRYAVRSPAYDFNYRYVGIFSDKGIFRKLEKRRYSAYTDRCGGNVYVQHSERPHGRICDVGKADHSHLFYGFFAVNHVSMWIDFV